MDNQEVEIMQTVIKAALTAHKTRWLLVGLLCLALWPKLAAAQSPELMEAYNRHVALVPTRAAGSDDNGCN